MHTLLLSAILLVPLADNAVKIELKKLEGAWSVIVPEDDPNARLLTLEIAGDRFTVVLDEKNKVKIKAVVHPATNPKCIDLELEDKTTIEGIYRLEGDMLTFCIGQANAKDRPTEFPEKSAPGIQVVRFKRKVP